MFEKIMSYQANKKGGINITFNVKEGSTILLLAKVMNRVFDELKQDGIIKFAKFHGAGFTVVPMRGVREQELLLEVKQALVKA